MNPQDGYIQYIVNPKSGASSSNDLVRQFKDYLIEKIKITTVDKFSKKISDRIAFIKIDTEGFEPQVLRGAKETIKKDKPIIYIELGGDNLESSLEALKVLKELGYQCEAENIDLKTIPAGVNFIATPKF